MSKTAIILGATGLTGSLLTELLINDSLYSNITILIRKAIHFKNPKIKKVIYDLLHPETFKDRIDVLPHSKIQTATKSFCMLQVITVKTRHGA